MSTLGDKLDQIEDKVLKIAEQNVQYKEVCNNLMLMRKQLEEENIQLKNELDEYKEKVAKLEQLSRDVGLADLGDKEEIKKILAQYIRDIDSTINWLKES